MYSWTVFKSRWLHASLKGSEEGLGGVLNTKGLTELSAMDSNFFFSLAI